MSLIVSYFNELLNISASEMLLASKVVKIDHLKVDYHNLLIFFIFLLANKIDNLNLKLNCKLVQVKQFAEIYVNLNSKPRLVIVVARAK